MPFISSNWNKNNGETLVIIVDRYWWMMIGWNSFRDYTTLYILAIIIINRAMNPSEPISMIDWLIIAIENHHVWFRLIGKWSIKEPFSTAKTINFPEKAGRCDATWNLHGLDAEPINLNRAEILVGKYGTLTLRYRLPQWYPCILYSHRLDLNITQRNVTPVAWRVWRCLTIPIQVASEYMWELSP